MLSAEAIVDQIQHGQIPDHWHIVKGHGSPLKAALQMLVCCLLGWLLGIGLGYVMGGNISISWLNLVGLAPFLILIFQAWRREREAQHSFLIMEPEGFMLLTHSNSPSKCRLTTWFYRYITDIDLKLRYPLNFTKNPAVRMNISTANGTHFWVDIDTRFGFPLKTAQTIIVAHAQYRALYAYAA